MFLRLYETGKEKFGKTALLELVEATTCGAAREVGRQFAESAPGGPSLAHFSTMLDVWRAGGALDIVDSRCTDAEWTFRVVRCRYLEAYRELGLPDELSYAVSCARDACLARGYSDRLRLDRPAVISRGAPACLFRFVWEGRPTPAP